MRQIGRTDFRKLSISMRQVGAVESITMPWHRSFRDANLCNGNLFKSFFDIQVSAAKGARLVMQRAYDSQDDRIGPFEQGWTHAYLSADDRRNLYEFMIFAAPTTCQAILAVCEKAQDTLALPFVQRLVRRYRKKGGSNILTQAIHCYEVLTTSYRASQDQFLLRAATGNRDNELLKPAADDKIAPQELLKSSSGKETDPPHGDQ
jgi:hypothetical protein